MGHARQKDNMENRDLRRRRALSVLTFDATNVPLDGAIVMSVPFSGTAVKHGKLPVSISSITDDVNGQSDLTPVDPAGGHRYRNSIKTCESRVVMDSADCSVTRG